MCICRGAKPSIILLGVQGIETVCCMPAIKIKEIIRLSLS